VDALAVTSSAQAFQGLAMVQQVVAQTAKGAVCFKPNSQGVYALSSTAYSEQLN
jgi:hypothetical protein